MEQNLPKFTILQLFSSRALLFPTVISIVLHLSQQLSGINAVGYFSLRLLINYINSRLPFYRSFIIQAIF